MSLSPRHERSASALSRHPYRDSALLYGGLAIALVVVSALSGSGLVRAVVVAVAFFVLATGWAWFRLHRRLRAAAGEAGR